MALLGLHFFNLPTPRWASQLHGLLPMTTLPKIAGFKRLSANPASAEACARASAIYAGTSALTAETFLDLSWLESFARSGRQLLLCHALRLLQGWTEQRQTYTTLQGQVDVLHRLCQAAPDFVFYLNPDLLQPFTVALQQQVLKVWGAKPRSWADHVVKADVLLRTARLLQDGERLRAEATRLLDASVPFLVAEDGSPTQNTLSDYVAWLSPLLDASDMMFAPATRQALDRSAPFLAMLKRADGLFCFNLEKPVASIAATLPLRHAHCANFAHVVAGKTTANVLSEPHNVTAQISISAQGHHLFDASFAPASTRLENHMRVESSEVGHLVYHATSHFQRTLFVSPKGDDLRVEELRQDGCENLFLKLNPDLRIAIARAGTQATLSLSSKLLWQLSLRGGSLSETSDPTVLRVTLNNSCLNWAVKSITRDTTKSQKSQALELPF